MKHFSLIAFIAILLISPIASAESGHDHSHEVLGGPKGGRLLEHTEPQAEFYLEKDRTATITFYDKESKQVAAEGQIVVANADKDGVKTKIEFDKKGDVLVSKEPFPEGAPNLVLQFKQTENAKPANFRFELNDAICGECQRAEYACICAH